MTLNSAAYHKIPSPPLSPTPTPNIPLAFGAKRSHYRHCPKCVGGPFDKSICDEHDVATCPKCQPRFRFCWDCEVDFDSIARTDSRSHKRSCRYHGLVDKWAKARTADLESHLKELQDALAATPNELVGMKRELDAKVAEMDRAQEELCKAKAAVAFLKESRMAELVSHEQREAALEAELAELRRQLSFQPKREDRSEPHRARTPTACHVGTQVVEVLRERCDAQTDTTDLHGPRPGALDAASASTSNAHCPPISLTVHANRSDAPRELSSATRSMSMQESPAMTRISLPLPLPGEEMESMEVRSAIAHLADAPLGELKHRLQASVNGWIRRRLPEFPETPGGPGSPCFPCEACRLAAIAMHSAGVPSFGDETPQRAAIRCHHALAAAAGIRPGDVFLDADCGAGLAVHDIAKFSGAKGVGVGTDFESLRFAQFNSESSGLQARATYHCWDAKATVFPFPADAFDAVVTVSALQGTRRGPPMFNGDCRLLFSEIFRVTKPGKCYVGSAWIRTERFDEGNSQHRVAVHAIERAVRRDNAQVDGSSKLLTAEELLQMLRSAGFVIDWQADDSERFEHNRDTNPWYQQFELQPKGMRADGQGSGLGNLLRRIGSAPRDILRAGKAGCSCSPTRIDLQPPGFSERLAKALALAGRMGIVSPRFIFLARKPISHFGTPSSPTPSVLSSLPPSPPRAFTRDPCGGDDASTAASPDPRAFG